jgi:hypothetical protein
MDKEEVKSTDADDDYEEEEQTLLQIDCQKDFLLFFKKSYHLVITDMRVVLVYSGGDINNSSDIKRSLSYSKLKGITKSVKENACAMVIHVKKAKDELIYLEIEEAIELIKKVYASLTKK